MGDVKLTIEALPQGGFVVVGPGETPAHLDTLLRAATTLDEALAYVRTRMRPEPEAVPGELPTPEQIAAEGPTTMDAWARARAGDQGALSREAMTAAVERRTGGLWRA